MSGPVLTHEQHAAVFDAVLRALEDAHPDLFDASRDLDPGGLGDLGSHIDDLVPIVRRTTASTIEPYLAQILDEICSTCRYQYPGGFCSLRHRKLCVLYSHAEPIVRAVAEALGQLQDEQYLANHQGQLGVQPKPRKRCAMFSKILIAFDTGEASRHAVDVGVRLAIESNARLGLIYVAAPPVGYLSEAALAAQRLLNEERERAQMLFKEFRSSVPDTTDITQFAPEGDAADEIVATASRWGADLIVVGTHGGGRLGTFLLGSTAQAVIRKSRCPVLVVRQPRDA